MTLDGIYRLRTTRVVDIAKPNSQPIADIDEPENEDEAREAKLNQNNARMLQFTLKDSNNTEIRAIEMERIPDLDNIQNNWSLLISGPVVVRCGNMMLEKRNVIGKAKLSDLEVAQSSTQVEQPSPIRRPPESSLITAPNNSENICPDPKRPSIDVVNLVDVAEDWDEEDDDDCIIIE